MSEPYLASIGKVIAAWSLLDGAFNLFFGDAVVSKFRHGTVALTPRYRALMKLPFKKQLPMLKQAVRAAGFSPEFESEIFATLGSIAHLKKERDKVAHAAWGPYAVLGEGSNPLPVMVADKAVRTFRSWATEDPHETSYINRSNLETTFLQIQQTYWRLHAICMHPEMMALATGGPPMTISEQMEGERRATILEHAKEIGRPDLVQMFEAQFKEEDLRRGHA